MTGPAIKKYAESHGLTCDGGAAYGKIHGHYISLSDGMCVKVLEIYLFPPTDRSEESAALSARATKTLLSADTKAYRLSRQNPVLVRSGRIVVTFQDNPGTMACVERYIDEILPMLEAAPHRCASCGRRLSGDGRFVLSDGSVFPVHPDCVAELSARTLADPPTSGHVLRGALGAAVGAMLGTLVWAFVFVLGYLASLAGILIAFLSAFFYDRFGGKKGFARVAAVILALIAGVFLGQTMGYTAHYLREYDSIGGFPAVGMTARQYELCMWEQFIYTDQTVALGNMYDRMIVNASDDESAQLYTRDEFIAMNLNPQYETLVTELRGEFAGNVALGLLFGSFACVVIFRRRASDVKPRSVRLLK